MHLKREKKIRRRVENGETPRRNSKRHSKKIHSKRKEDGRTQREKIMAEHKEKRRWQNTKRKDNGGTQKRIDSKTEEVGGRSERIKDT